MIHDIDAHISRISGQENYMEHLESITGNYLSIDTAHYKKKLETLVKCDSNIKILFKKISSVLSSGSSIPPAFSDIYKTYIIESNKASLQNTYTLKHKKNKSPQEVIATGHKPAEYVMSDWFACVKKIELEINNFKKDIVGDLDEELENDLLFHKAYQKILSEFAKDPLLVRHKTIFDVQMSEEEISNSFMLMHKCTKRIIDILLLPMYDVHATITKHWDQLKKVFREGTFQRLNYIGPEAIVLMLEQFVIAKYRATITNNNGHYVKLFFNLVGDENISSLDGPRFLEMMDSIDLDQLNREDKIYSFANSAKATLKQIVNKEKLNVDEVIKQFQELFNNTEVEKTEEEKAKENNAENQIL
jgi:hypothetical protein